MMHNHWKTTLAFATALIALLSVSNTALAQDCSANCLRVFSIVLNDQGSTIKGTVKLIDETGAGAGVRSAVVHAVWTRPDGSMLDQYDVIGTRLRAEFSLYTAGAPGTYILTVAGATKAGYTFDPINSSILNDSITVADTLDTDQDGIIDQLDNCLLVSNPEQIDTDSDGFGNACDADLNNDCLINFNDLSLFGTVFFGSDQNADLNNDNVVNFLDLVILQSAFFNQPGPTSTVTACD